MSKPEVTIIDYGVGNLLSVQRGLEHCGGKVIFSADPEEILAAKRVVLPGVGAFDYAMSQLNNSGMRARLDELVLVQKIPVIGICVGMQMMGNKSDEGHLEGLKWFDASIKKFDMSSIHQRTKLPHMGWNDVYPQKKHPLFKGLEQDALFYFLHSYYFESHNKEDILAQSDYGKLFTSAAHHDNIFGIQFHPEKSHEYGEQLLHNFANL